MNSYDVIIIGGGQSGLAVGYYLRRTGLDYIVLDSEEEPGGAWLHTWNSLRLFSPAQWSSLPGTMMQGGQEYYPTREETINYLKTYEKKYQLQIKRPVTVHQVKKQQAHFELDTSEGVYQAKAVVSATGTYRNPYMPDFPNVDKFKGTIMHSSQYQSPENFKNQRVAVIGEGNSGAQILSEVSKVADTLWITNKKPRFLPDEVDGRYLFDAATRMYEAKKQCKDFKPPSLGDIVMVPPVKEAKEKGVLESFPPFKEFSTHSLIWNDGRKEAVDTVIFCTGFQPALAYLESLGIIHENSEVTTIGTRSKDIEGLWLVGYGNWTGFASATLIGVGRSARQTVEEVKQYLSILKES